MLKCYDAFLLRYYRLKVLNKQLNCLRTNLLTFQFPKKKTLSELILPLVPFNFNMNL